ncbi:MAG: WD40 repeat domain-containing serine/threonine protein kinase [bacterium]
MSDEPTADDLPDVSGDAAGRADAGNAEYVLPQIPGYRVTGRLGEGGMGTVWRAVQLSTRRPVAVKVLGLAAFGSEKARVRFEREVELTARLEHPHIARVYDSGLRRGFYYYAMELVDGVPLDRYVREKELGDRAILELMRAVCRAVEYAHQRGIIHRDLKPSNIVVTEGGTPHVLDFGLAKAFEEEGAEVSADGDVAGTPAYMSPEQAAGRTGEVGTRTDVYSLGVVLFRLLTGEPPHDLSGTRYDVIRRIIEEEPRRPRDVRGDIDRELDALLLKALARDPEERYVSAGDQARDISNYLAGDPLIARKPTATYFLAKRLRKHRVPVAIGIGVVLVLIAMAVYGYVRIAQQKGLAERAAHQERLAREEAQSAEREARARLIQSYVERGWRRYDESDYAGALLWHVEALRVAEEAARRLPGVEADIDNHRVRIRGVLARVPRLDALLFHRTRVFDARFSGDGRRIVTAGQDAARAWTIPGGEPAGAAITYPQPANDAALSRDSSHVVTSHDDGTARVWAFPTGRPVTPPFQHDVAVYRARFTPDGRRVLTLTADRVLAIWDTARADPKPVTFGEGVRFGDVTEDGRRLVTLARDGAAQVRDTATGEAVGRPLEHGAPVRRAAFSPDGSLVATVGRERIKFWDAATGEPVRPDIELPAPVGRIAFGPGGRLLVAPSHDVVRVWDVTTGRQAREPLEHGTTVDRAVLGPRAERLLIAGADAAHVWNLETGEPETPLLRHSGGIRGAAFSPDGERVMTSGYELTRLWGVGGEAVGEATGRGTRPGRVAVSPDRRRYVALVRGEPVRVCDVQTGEPLSPPLEDAGTVVRVAFSPDGGRLATAALDQAPRVWDAATGKPLTPPLEQAPPVLRARFGPAGRRLVTAGFDQTAQVWDAGSGERVGRVLEHDGPVIDAAFSPDGRQVATAGADRIARVWDVSTGALAAKTSPHPGVVRQVVYSPSGKLLATAASGTASLWDARTCEPAGRPLKHSGDVAWLEFGPDGDRLLTGSRDKTAVVWDVSTGRPAAPPLRHAGAVRRARFSRDGQRVVTASRDRSARVWDASTGEPVSPPLRHRGAVADAVFLPGGEGVVTMSGGGPRTWSLEPDRRPVAELVGIARLLSSQKIDRFQSAALLSPEELRRLWQHLIARYPGGRFVPSP